MGNSPKHYLEYLIKNPNDKKAINHLIETSFLIAKTYLKMKYFSNHEQKLKWSENLDDIAMDAIVPLFIVNGSGKLGILRALDNWESDLKDNPDTLFFLNRVIWKRVEQTIIKLIKQKDPIFAKIHKNLSACVSNYNLGKINYFGTLYIVGNKVKQISGKVIDNGEFEKLPTYLFTKKQFELCNGILTYLINNTDFFPAIPMSQLVKRLKVLHFADNLGSDVVNNEFGHNIDVDNALGFSLDKIKDKINNFYIKHNKLNINDSTAIYNSFIIIAEEMKNGGVNSSLYEYLSVEISGLTKDDFYKKYHGIMNYLLNEFKRNFIEFVEEKSSK